ncbi:MAG: hypothetical protein CXT77_02710 [uncultured DHVE6 group euryarchaeote]|nr:MAG: hypothetical protein CXT77_02710 [uncultured DHVE6 group euryarchaeote]
MTPVWITSIRYVRRRVSSTNKQRRRRKSSEYGNTGERIEGSEWCCIPGYLAKEVGALNSLNPDEAACTQYENKIPNAVISTNVTNISIGETITFDASSSRDSDGIIKEYIWTFGDGSPQETGVTVEHKFETACAQDICIITLNVKDNFNNIGEEIINLNMTGIIVSEVNGTQVNGTQVDDKGDDGTGGVYDWGATSEEDDEDDGTKGSAAGWLIILAILVIMGGVYFAFKKGLFSKKKEPEPIDLDSETFEAEEPVKEKKDTGKMSGFISDQKDKGLSNEEIRQKLLGKGLSDDEVDKHMNESRE